MGQPNSLGTLEILISLSVFCLLVDFKIFTQLPFAAKDIICLLKCCTSSFVISLRKTIAGSKLDESVGKKILQLSVS